MDTRKTVSLFLYIPQQRTIVLGVRAPDQSYPHLLQATCHGTIEEGEDHADALERELKEETTLDLPLIGPITFVGELGSRHTTRNEQLDCSYYFASITEANAKKIRPTSEVGRFLFLSQRELPRILPWSKAQQQKIDCSRELVMFDDELEALATAFDVLSKHNWKME